MHFIFTILLSAILASFQGGSEKWIVQKTSEINVNGKSNVNSFVCMVSSFSTKDTMTFMPPKSNGASTVHCTLEVPIRVFDCGNKHMTKDLQKTLNMSSFPSLYIKFSTFSIHPSKWVNGTKVQADALITISGVTKSYKIAYTVSRSGDQRATLKGQQKVLFSEFYLKPPTKLGGAIRVYDDLIVDMTMHLTKEE